MVLWGIKGITVPLTSGEVDTLSRCRGRVRIPQGLPNWRTTMNDDDVNGCMNSPSNPCACLEYSDCMPPDLAHRRPKRPAPVPAPMTANEAYEDGRKQAISGTRFCGDVVSMPPNAELHIYWIQGWLGYSGGYKEVGEAYYRWLSKRHA